MTHHYEATFRIDAAKAIQSVGEFVQNVNDHLSAMGVQERFGVSAEIFRLDVSVDRELSPEEQRKMRVLLEASVIETFPQYDVRLADFRSKSVTSEQSAG